MRGKFKIILSFLVVLFIIGVSISGIRAYMSDREQAVNTMIIGDVSVDLIEPDWEDGAIIYPGIPYPKNPQVLNTGVTDAYIFLEVQVPYQEVVTLDEDGSKDDKTWIELFEYSINNGWVEIGEPLIDEDNKVVTHMYAYIGDEVEKLEALKPDEITSTLFDEVIYANVIEGGVENGEDLNIIVKSYAIQTSVTSGLDVPKDVLETVINQNEGTDNEVTFNPTNLSRIIVPGPDFVKTIPSGVTKVVFTDAVAPEGVATLDVSEVQDGGVVSWSSNGTYYVSTQRTGLTAYSNPNSSSMFLNKTAITSIDTRMLETHLATTMASMFDGCAKLTQVDISNWDVSNVTSLKALFQNCTSLKSVDMSDWDVGNVTDMSLMFTVSSPSKGYMKIESIGDTSDWDTSSVVNFNNTFRMATSLKELNVSNWDTSNVKNIAGMFNFYEAPGSLKVLDVSNWDVSKVTSLQATFDDLQVEVLDISNWDVSNVTSFNHTFADCRKVKVLDVSNWNTSKVTTFNAMFNDCESLTSLDLSNWNTGKVTDMNQMFENCKTLTELDLRSFNTSSVKSTAQMFRGGSGLQRILGLENFNTSKVDSMFEMFRGCSSLTQLDLSSFDSTSLTKVAGMFYGCTRLSDIEFSDKFNMANVTFAFNMFRDCSRLEELDLSHCNISKVYAIDNMFSGCGSLKKLDISGLNTSNLTGWTFTSDRKDTGTGMANVFYNCVNLQEVKLGEGFAYMESDDTCYLPETRSGYWYSSDGVAYTPDSIPNNVADTYYSTPR